MIDFCWSVRKTEGSPPIMSRKLLKRFPIDEVVSEFRMATAKGMIRLKLFLPMKRARPQVAFYPSLCKIFRSFTTLYVTSTDTNWPNYRKFCLMLLEAVMIMFGLELPPRGKGSYLV